MDNKAIDVVSCIYKTNNKIQHRYKTEMEERAGYDHHIFALHFVKDAL